MTTNKEKFLISLNLKLHKTQTKVPKFVVIHNNSELEIGDTTNINFFGTLGENTVSIKFFNKNSKDTKIDSTGNIIEDLAIEIQEFVVDGIQLTHEFKNYAVYYSENQTETFNTYGFMHTNGTLQFNFQCPGFYFKRNINILTQQ